MIILRKDIEYFNIIFDSGHTGGGGQNKCGGLENDVNLIIGVGIVLTEND